MATNDSTAGAGVRPAYRAFISYSHAADGRLAPALQAALQGLAKPWYRLRAMRIFRDKTSLSASPELWPAIERALAASKWFLLMASPESAQSHWVEQELLWWLKHRSCDRLLIVLTDGELVWDSAGGDFDWDRTTALGRGLAGQLASEPLFVDLRWARSEDKLSLRHARFRDTVLDLAAPLRERPKDELDGEDVRQHRRTRRIAWTAASALAVLTVAAVGAAAVAVQQARVAELRRVEAEAERRVAVSRQLAAQSEVLRGQRADLIPTSLLLAVESLRRGFSLEAVQSLQKGLQLLAVPGALTVRHDDNANDARLGADDRWLLTASDDGTARLWDAATGAERTRLEIGGRVFELHTSSDGRRLAARVYGSSEVQVWDLEGRRLLARLDHGAVVDAVAISPDGASVATGARDSGLRLWDVASGRERWRSRHGSWVVAVAFAPDGGRIVSGSADRTTRMWQAADGSELWRHAHAERVTTVAFGADGTLVASGGWDLHARVFDAGSGRELARSAHGRVVTALAFDASGKMLAAASDDGRASIIAARSGEALGRFAPEGGVLGLAWSPDGRLLATRGLSRVVHVWDVAAGHEAARLPFDALPGSVAFGPRGDTLVVAVADGTVRTLRLGGAPPRHGEVLHAASLSPDGRHVALARSEHAVDVVGPGGGAPHRLDLGDGVDELLLGPAGQLLVTHNERPGRLQVWDVATGQLRWQTRARQSGPGQYWMPPALSPDGRWLTQAWGQAHGLAVLETASGRVIGRAAHDGVLMHRGFSPDGRWLATAGDRSVRVWQVDGMRLQRRLDHDDDAMAAAFSADATLLATGGADGFARLWDLASGAERRRLDHHGDVVVTLAFSPDGRMLATSAGDKLRLWQVDSGALALTLRHDGGVDYLAFSPDGRHLASGSRDHSARVWDLAAGVEVARMTDLGEAFRVAFDADARFLLVEHHDAASRFWRMWLWRPQDLAAAVCARVARNLSRDEWQRYLGNEGYVRTCPDLPEGEGPAR